MLEITSDSNAIDGNHSARNRVKGDVGEGSTVVLQFLSSEMVGFDVKLSGERKVVEIYRAVLVSFDMAKEWKL